MEVFHFLVEEVDIFVGEEDVFGQGLQWIFAQDLGLSLAEGDFGSDGCFFPVARLVVDGVGEEFEVDEEVVMDFSGLSDGSTGRRS